MRFTEIGACVGILFTLSVGCSEPQPEKTLIGVKGDTLQAFRLEKQPAAKEFSFPAELLPVEKADIFPRVNGYVKSVRVDIGDRVTRGQVLAVLEAPEMSSETAQANAELQTARSTYEGSLDTYQRIEKAAKTEGTIAASELEKAKSKMMADKAAVEASSSKLNAIRDMNNYLVLRAPFNGIVTRRNADPGYLANTSARESLLTVENAGILHLRVPVPEAYLASRADSTGIRFTVDALPGKVFNARLSRRAGSLDPVSRTETWEFLYPNKDHQLKPGMFANAVLKMERPAPTFMVPAGAVSTNLEKRFVIRVKDGKAEWVDVRVGIAAGDKTEIFGTLEEGDVLLIRATDEIKPGKTVNTALKK